MSRATCTLAGPACVFSFVFAFPALGQNAPNEPPRAQDLIINITANRSPTAVQRTGSAITVISGEEIRRTSPGSLVDVLRWVPGLSTVENGGPGSVHYVMLRGAESRHTLVLIDGVRVNDPSGPGSEFDFQSLAPGLIDRIEVLRGPQSALYGSDALGGVINIITKRGKGPFQGYAQIEGGSYGTLAGNAGFYGTQGPWSYALGLASLKTDGFSRYGYRIGRLARTLRPLEPDGMTRNGAYLRAGYDAGSGVRFEVSSMVTALRSQFDAGFGARPDSASTYAGVFHNSSIKAEVDSFDDRVTHTVTLSGNRSKRNLFSDSSFGPAWFDFVGTRLAAEYQARIKAGEFGSLILGTKYEREMIDTYSTYGGFFPVPRTKDIGTGQDTRALFALWQGHVGDRFDYSLGGRIDDVIGAATFRTWRATMAYRFDETGTKLRASVGTGGKAPTLYQLYDSFNGNPNLKSERSFGGDVGIDQRFWNDRAKASVSLFSNRMKGLIDWRSTGLFTGRYFNVAHARTSGVETALEAALLPERVDARLSHTFLNARDSDTGMKLARRPTNQIKFGLAYTPDDTWRFEPTLTMASGRYSSPQQLDRLAPYARLDMRASYAFTKDSEFYVRGENLTNARYQEVRDYGTTGRAIYAGLKTSF